MPNRVSDMVFDEVSLVDRPANQFASVVLAKRANQEAAVDFFDGDGEPVDIQLSEDGEFISGTYADGEPVNEGDLLQLGDGEIIQVGDGEDESELAEAVGKSAFLAPPAPRSEIGKSILDGLRAELSKAVTDEDRDQALAKAFSTYESRLGEAESLITKAARAAEAERNIRLEREYIAKADSYGLPVAADVLGPVLKRVAEAVDYADQVVLDECLTSAGAAFTEIGKAHSGGDEIVDSFLDGVDAEEFAKAAGDQDLSPSVQLSKFLEKNPGEYGRYRRHVQAGH